MTLTPSRLARLTVLVGALTVVFAFVGFGVDSGSIPLGWTDRVFRSVALLALQPHGVGTNRWLAIANVGALLFSLLAIGAVVLSVSISASAWLVGTLSYLSPRRGHAVVVGLGGVGMQLLKDLRTGAGSATGAGGRRRRVIVIEPDRSHPGLEEARSLGGVVVTGDPRAEALRRKARVHLARELFIASGDDALNVDVVGRVLADLRDGSVARSERYRKHAERGYRHLQCHVHSADPLLSRELIFQDLLRAKAEPVDVHVFDVDDNAARQLLLDEAQGLARRYAPTTAEVAQYVVVGFGEMGQTVARQMARLAHFASCRRLRLSLVDSFPAGASAAGRFLERHPGFSPGPDFRLDPLLAGASAADGWDCREFRPEAAAWRFEEPGVVEYAVNAEFLDLPGEVDAPAFIERLARRLWPRAGLPVRAAMVVCFDDDRRNVHAALALRKALLEHLDAGGPPRPVPIYAFLPEETGLASLLAGHGAAEEPFPLHVFGRIDESGSYSEVVRPTIRKLAGLLHHVYQEALGDPGDPDAEQATSEDPIAVYQSLPAAFRVSSEDAAAHADIKLDAIGLRRRPAKAGDARAPVEISQEQVELLARMEHNRWMGERLVSGWRWGERDDVRKRRLAFRPWKDLPDAEERAKDRRQVEALVRALGLAGQVVEAAPGR